VQPEEEISAQPFSDPEESPGSQPQNDSTALAAASTPAVPIMSNEDNDPPLFSVSMLHWLRRLGKLGLASSERLHILQKAIHDIKKITSPRPGSKRIPLS